MTYKPFMVLWEVLNINVYLEQKNFYILSRNICDGKLMIPIKNH